MSARKLLTPLLLLALLLALVIAFAPRIHLPRTVEFDPSLSFTEINGYKFHTETFGRPDAPPVIIVHGGPSMDYGYLKTLAPLSKDYFVVFYDQRGAGLSPRVARNQQTLEQSLIDLDAIVDRFAKGKKVKLIGHSWGAMLTVGYLSQHGDKVSQAVIVEPGMLNPQAPKAWTEKFTQTMGISLWSIAPYVIAYPFVIKEDGQEGFDYVSTKLANQSRPGPPYECDGHSIPPDTFKRLSYEAYAGMVQPVMENPASFTDDLTKGIAAYRGDLMLISSDCSIIGHAF